jgi:hypothetical protein
MMIYQWVDGLVASRTREEMVGRREKTSKQPYKQVQLQQVVAVVGMM